MRKYRITCLSCKESDVHTINEDEHVVTYSDNVMLTNLLSFRWRSDMKWGFLCVCGNDNRLCKQEEKDFDKLVAGDPMSLKKIADSLNIPDESQFRMEPA